MDNLRIWDFEKDFDSKTCPYIPFFKDVNLAAYINDGIPLWHRADASLFFGRHVAPTYIGHISMRELRIQHKILHDDGKKVIIIGGKKPKFAEYFENPKKGKTIYSRSFAEDGGRLYLKTNQNMLIEVDENEEIEVPDNYIWLTMYQIKQLLKYDNLINPHVRGIISYL